MTNINDDEYESSESTEVVLSLFGVLLKSTVEKELQWLSKSVEVDQSEHLKSIVFSAFVHEELGNCGDHIEDEVSGQVVLADMNEIFVSSGLFNEVEQDLNELNNVDGDLEFVKLVLPWVLGINLETTWVVTSGGLFFSSAERDGSFCRALTLIKMRENI